MSMRTLLLFSLALLLIPRVSSPQDLIDGEVTELYPSGEVHIQYSVNEEGQKHGAFVEYAEDGTALVKARYAKDKLDGREQRFFAGGKRHIVATWKSGELNGRYEIFYRNGKREISTGYKRGLQAGKYTESSEDGKWVLTANHKAGQLDGALKVRDNGKTLSEQKWKAGVPIEIDGIEPFPRAEISLLGELAGVWGAPAPAEVPKLVGELTEEERVAAQRAQALRRLQAYRALCEVPYKGMSLEPKWNALCDAASEICRRLGRITHTPERPADTGDELYKDGVLGAGKSNLAMGGSLPSSVDMYMDDSDASNIDRIGHRRWCVNPTMQRTGFGVSGRFSAMWSMDNSGRGVRGKRAVMFPPEGFVPTQMFGAHYAWSITPLAGALPKEEKIQVTMQPLGRHYLPEGEPLKIDYLHVDNGGYGAGPCLIFRPEGLVMEVGRAYRCQVSLDNGGSVAFDYFVEFASDERLTRR